MYLLFLLFPLFAFCTNDPLAYTFCDKIKGQKDTLTVIFIHGIDSSRESWFPIVDQLEGNYRLYAIDLRGHGESPMTSDLKKNFELDQLISDVDQFAITHHLDQFVLVAQSFGVRIAIPYAAKYPEKILGLVLGDLDPFPKNPIDLTDERIAFLSSFKQDHSSFEDAKAELVKFNCTQSEIDKFVKTGIIREISPKQWHIRFHPLVRPLAHMGCSISKIPYESYKKLNDYSFPMLLLKAENGSFVSPEGLSYMTEQTPRLRVKTIPGSTHGIHKTNPSAFVESLSEFLDHIDFLSAERKPTH